MDDQGRVYKIRPLNQQGPEKMVNRAQLKVYPSSRPVLPESPSLMSPSLARESEGTSMLKEESEMGSVIMVNWPLLTQPPIPEPNTSRLVPTHIPEPKTEPQLNSPVHGAMPPTQGRCSSRTTAGHHSNIFKLPHSIHRPNTNDATPQVSSQTALTFKLPPVR